MMSYPFLASPLASPLKSWAAADLAMKLKQAFHPVHFHVLYLQQPYCWLCQKNWLPLQINLSSSLKSWQRIYHLHLSLMVAAACQLTALTIVLCYHKGPLLQSEVSEQNHHQFQAAINKQMIMMLLQMFRQCRNMKMYTYI